MRCHVYKNLIPGYISGHQTSLINTCDKKSISRRRYCIGVAIRPQNEEIDENATASDLSKLPEFKEQQRAWRTVIGTVGKTRFSIFYYKYKVIDTFLEFEGITLIGKKDIAAMKIHAISQRSTKRDFIDLYMLSKEFSLENILNFYNEKYGVLEENMYSILKGLNYFVEADKDVMPEMFIPIHWEEVKEFFQKETRRLVKDKLKKVRKDLK